MSKTNTYVKMDRSEHLHDFPDGSVTTSEGYMSWVIPATGEECKTYYKIIGTLPSSNISSVSKSSPPPLILIHGGPGGGHMQLLPLWNLHKHNGTPLVFYDQVGCARSTHFRHRRDDAAF